jgi:hypothetical protein
MSASIEFIQHLYDRFNARQIDAVLASLHPDVVWANGMEGGYVYGHEGVREYWTRQWAMIDPHVEPSAIAARDGGIFEVEVNQIVRDLSGNLLMDAQVGHIFRIENELVTRFDIRPTAA